MGANAKKHGDAVTSRGRGGMGRRDTEDLFVEVTKPQHEQRQVTKASKGRLFRGVLNRFDRSDNSVRSGGSGGGGGESEVGSMESPSDARRWLTPGGSKASKTEGGAPFDSELGASTSASTPEAVGTPASTFGSGAHENGPGKPTATWVKPGKGVPTPDRFARFFGKMLGVRDDALPDGPVIGGGGGGEDIVGAGADEPARARGEAAQRSASNTDGIAQGASAAAGAGATGSSATGDGQQQSEIHPVSLEVQPSSNARASATAAPGPPAAAATPVTATAVYPATAVSTATADAMPVAVAVAIPVTDGTAMRSGPAPSARRPSRSSRTHRSAGGARAENDASAPGVGDEVYISEWVVREQRESGGLVRVFSAQRVVEGKVQKRCRLAVSPKHMTQVRMAERFSECRTLGG